MNIIYHSVSLLQDYVVVLRAEKNESLLFVATVKLVFLLLNILKQNILLGKNMLWILEITTSIFFSIFLLLDFSSALKSLEMFRSQDTFANFFHSSTKLEGTLDVMMISKSLLSLP